MVTSALLMTPTTSVAAGTLTSPLSWELAPWVNEGTDLVIGTAVIGEKPAGS